MHNGCYAPRRVFKPLILALAFTPTPAPSPVPQSSATVASITGPLPWIWAVSGLALACSVVAIVVVLSRRRAGTAQPFSASDRDLEALRIERGFWLIIAGLVLSLVVTIVTVALVFVPSKSNTGDVVAVITAMTGVIGTLIAAFFGVQAAGAGRSQLLDKIQPEAKPLTQSASLQPSYGPLAGNTRISITGNGFTGANAVNFGSKPGVNFELVNDGLLYVTSPPAPDSSKADVAVIFPTPAQQNIAAGTFYYFDIVPPSGPMTGETRVEIRGSGLTGAMEVRFAGEPGSNFNFVNDGKITVIAPPTSSDVPCDADVVVIFPENSPTNCCTVGKFRYEQPAPITR